MSNRDSKGGDTELSRVLRDTFGRVSNKEADAIEKSLGDYDFSQVNVAGRTPGYTYAGGPQSQDAGPQGRVSRELNDSLAKIFGGLDRTKCGFLGNEDCVELVSRMLEETFRNFQLTARRPSHIDPPFSAKPIDAFSIGPVVIPDGAPGAFTTVATFTMPAARYRGVIVAAGQSAESAAAYEDMEWRITLDGIPLQPWDSIMIQLWNMVPPTPLFAGILLRARQTVALQVRTRAGLGPHSALGRLVGWYYPVRSESGDEIRSTIVD